MSLRIIRVAISYRVYIVYILVLGFVKMRVDGWEFYIIRNNISCQQSNVRSLSESCIKLRPIVSPWPRSHYMSFLQRSDCWSVYHCFRAIRKNSIYWSILKISGRLIICGLLTIFVFETLMWVHSNRSVLCSIYLFLQKLRSEYCVSPQR